MTTTRSGNRLKKLCDDVFKQRIEELRVRVGGLIADGIIPIPKDTDLTRISTEELVLLSKATRGYLLGIGDSWLDYFAIDILDFLTGPLGYSGTSVAVAGTSLQAIVQRPAQLTELSREIELTIGGTAPKAILLSGGGNDLVDFGLQNLLRDFSAGPPRLIGSAVDKLIDNDIRAALVEILDCITCLCDRWLKKKVPILIHGYDYPIPDGRRLEIADRGPWLEPGFCKRGYKKADLPQSREVMKDLIDRLNAMQLTIAGQPGFEHVKHVNLRGTLVAPDYTKDWENELHPTYDGFGLVSRKFDRMIRTL